LVEHNTAAMVSLNTSTLLACISLSACTPSGQGLPPAGGQAPAQAGAPIHGGQDHGDPLAAFDILQHTCALYVALHSRALDERISFGRNLSDAQVHWNMCPGGTMVACATAPAPHGGEPVRAGIPWPYAPPASR